MSICCMYLEVYVRMVCVFSKGDKVSIKCDAKNLRVLVPLAHT